MKERLERVRERIKGAAEACSRPVTDIRLVAVSKTKPAAVVKEALEAGVTDLGENYIQEAKDKINELNRILIGVSIANKNSVITFTAVFNYVCSLAVCSTSAVFIKIGKQRN